MTEKRPQNCGTGYCSCIECPYEAEQAEQEPVLWGDDKFAPHERPQKPEECANGCPPLQVCDYCQTAEQAEQEPVAWLADGQLFYTKDVASIEPLIPLYAAPVRTKDLTDDELDIFIGEKIMDMRMTYRDLCRAVIAAYKEKNK